MTLVELCEPLFQYICRLNRSARKGGHHTREQVRQEVTAILSDIRNRAKSDGRLVGQIERNKIYLVLLFFTDSMIRNSSLSFAMEWNDLAYEEQEMGGEEKFFEMLEAELADPSDAATERVAVYYACMGLGFTGWYAGQPQYLRQKMLECSSRLRQFINTEDSICPEAYNPDTRMLFKPIGTSLVGITITLVVLVIAIFVMNVYLYSVKSKELRGSLGQEIAATDARQGDAITPTAAPKPGPAGTQASK